MLNTDLDRSVDELEQDFVACEMLITRLRARQAEGLRALDAHQVHHIDGARSMQEWVRARLDTNDGTARDLVHAARHFAEQSEVQAMADDGQFSFARVVATSRLVASGRMRTQSSDPSGTTSTVSIVSVGGSGG